MNASKEIGLEEDKWINISNSRHIEGTKTQYEFVTVYNLTDDGELEYFEPINPPILKIIQDRR